MGLRYEEIGRLMNGHEKGITKVSFSPGGSYIATAGLDGRVCIWDVDSRHLLHSFNGSCAVLSLVWIPPSEDRVLCGLQDGNMAILRISPHKISVTGFWAHAYPVECLAINPDDRRLASGAHRELLVWSWVESVGKFALENTISAPPKLGWNQADEEVVTSVHWTSSAQYPALLLATFMYHGILLIDANSWTRLRTVTPNGQIASASLSDDGMRLAIYNTVRGIHIYCMRTGVSLAVIDRGQGEDALPKSVLFIHGSLALVGGSSTGELKVWDVLDTITNGPTLNIPEDEHSRPTVMHTLPMPRRAKAAAVAAYYCEESDEFFIAAGMMSAASPSACIIWKATEHGDGQRGSPVRPRRGQGRLLAAVLGLLSALLVAYLLSAIEAFDVAEV